MGMGEEQSKECGTDDGLLGSLVKELPKNNCIVENNEEPCVVLCECGPVSPDEKVMIPQG